jgi:predicted dehydrogenase
MATKSINFGIIGCGLMGREFASAVARWCHLLDMDVTPRLIAVCDSNPAAMEWYQRNFPSITIASANYCELLSSSEIDAIYCAVPHNLHEQFYVDIIKSGKHLMAEKPFGIDQAANSAIINAVADNPSSLVRCSSEFPYYPGAQRILNMIRNDDIGEIIEVQAGFLHSSDLDPNKPINWKRQIAVNGEYGCMGDLGMHALHVPLRLGWTPINVRALLSNIVKERPGRDGSMEACETWDNAILSCEAKSAAGQVFPMTVETKRIAPGETNTWYLNVYGTRRSAKFTTKYPKTLQTMTYTAGGSQTWQSEDLGSKSAYATITGGIFEFGFSDSILQMWAAFCDEVVHSDEMHQPFHCATPEETAQSHKLFTAALESQRNRSVVVL